MLSLVTNMTAILSENVPYEKLTTEDKENRLDDKEEHFIHIIQLLTGVFLAGMAMNATSWVSMLFSAVFAVLFFFNYIRTLIFLGRMANDVYRAKMAEEADEDTPLTA